MVHAQKFSSVAIEIHGFRVNRWQCKFILKNDVFCVDLHDQMLQNFACQLRPTRLIYLILMNTHWFFCFSGELFSFNGLNFITKDSVSFFQLFTFSRTFKSPTDAPLPLAKRFKAFRKPFSFQVCDSILHFTVLTRDALQVSKIGILMHTRDSRQHWTFLLRTSARKSWCVS